MTSALAPLRVLDFSRVLAGPFATMMLADLGATVTKVERPGTGDDTRSWGPPHDARGSATYFQAVNRNKDTVVLDLATPEGAARARELAAQADVVVENFRPGVMDRLGLGAAQLRAADPGLVYCSITGFGRAGGAALPGYDLLVQAVGGLMSLTGDPDGEPQKAGVALVDVLAGLFACVGGHDRGNWWGCDRNGVSAPQPMISTWICTAVATAAARLGVSAGASAHHEHRPPLPPRRRHLGSPSTAAAPRLTS